MSSITVSIPIAVLIMIEIILMIGLPIAAVLLLKRRWALPFSLAAAGGITFIASQALHLPANALILARWLQLESQPLVVQAIALGLSAGIFEEVARYLVYRFWKTGARSWRPAVFFGLGHGGVESILTGLLVLTTLINVMVITTAEDPAALGLPEGALEQVAEFWAMPFYLPLLAAAERIMAMILHISLSTLVVLSVGTYNRFRRPPLWPLFAAILWHAIADAVAVYVTQTWGPVAAEGALAVIALLSVAILWWTRRLLPARNPEAEVTAA